MLKAWDGFDHYNAEDDLLARSDFIQYQTIRDPIISFVTGLAAGVGKAVRLRMGGGNERFRAVYTDRNAEGFVAWRWRVPINQSNQNLPSGTYFLFWDTVAAAAQVSVYFNPSNYAIQIYRGDVIVGGATLLYASPNNVWINDTAQFLEIGLKVDNSTGYVTVKLDGVTVATASGVDTQATANAYFDAVDIACAPILNFSTASYTDIDDHRYNDTAAEVGGALPNNTFIGDVGVKTLFMTGNGTVQFTPLSGSNYNQVNEQAMDSDTSYNYSSNPGDEDEFTSGTITNVITVIYGVRITIAARKDDVGSRVLKTGLKSGGTTSYGANHSLPDTYAYFCDNWILDPNTGANWTRTAVNAILPRYNLVS